MDKQGRLRYRGPCIQGPPDEPFLYLSWRIAGEGGWLMRAKAPLASLGEAYVDSLPEDACLETTVGRMGHRAPGAVQEWRRVG